MAQRLLHRLLLATSVPSVCGKGRPSDQTWRPRLVSMKKTCAGNSHATLSPQFFYFHSRSKNPATANITPRKAAFQKQRVQTQVQNHQSTTHKAKMLHELSPDMIKVIKILQGHKVNTKKQRMQQKMQKQQSTAHNSKTDS